MLQFRFGKLVRDKIVAHQLASGAQPSYRTLTDEEHKRELVNKIIEEANEITQADPENVAAEIADVQQAVDDLVEKYGLSRETIVAEQEAKNQKNGAFKEGLYIDSVSLAEDDKWVDYYRKHPDRYPEIR
jgi:predicted house-cleaning noncanonical NTP pyrophosphatase (MazG superfamily)